MGEAKRRKQLDSQYGSVPSLTSQNQKQKHVIASSASCPRSLGTRLRILQQQNQLSNSAIAIANRCRLGLIGGLISISLMTALADGVAAWIGVDDGICDSLIVGKKLFPGHVHCSF